MAVKPDNGSADNGSANNGSADNDSLWTKKQQTI